jgi:hypothetical protein
VEVNLLKGSCLHYFFPVLLLSVIYALSLQVYAYSNPLFLKEIKNPILAQFPNESFLNQIKNEKDFLPTPFYEQKKKEFEGIILEFETREHYHLPDQQDQKDHFEKLNEFSQKSLKETKSFHLNQKLTQAKLGIQKSFYNNRFLKIMHKPIAVVASLVAFSLGAPFKIKIDKDSILEVRSEVPAQKGELKLTSPVINTSLNVIALAPENRDPFVNAPEDPIQKSERYFLSASRGLGIFDLQSSLSYGTTTSTFSTAVSKQLHPRLTCVLDSSRVFKYERDGKRGEETLKFLYSYQF